ncbi:unnamed protein product [Owenia fusiformis]|uniref:Uncharacterized protein n=1 Tax=Owenia fusiformis TaxID=6347 RepID=A0A8S4MZK6_OWEFU|nr:unnamed protein product [Owenia fusiformis]
MQSVYRSPVESIDPEQNGSNRRYIPRRSNARPGFASQTTVFLGITQIVNGSLCIILAAMLIFLHSYVGKFVAGIWCGLLYVIGGIIGLAAGKRKTNSLILTYLVMSTINGVATSTLIAISSWGIYLDSHRQYYKKMYGDFELVTEVGVPQVALNATLLVLGIVLGGSTIWAAAVCCKAAGCCYAPEGVYTIPSPQVVYSPVQGAGGQQVLVFTQDPAQSNTLYALPQGYMLNQQGQMMVQIPASGVVQSGAGTDSHPRPLNAPIVQQTQS